MFEILLTIFIYITIFIVTYFTGELFKIIKLPKLLGYLIVGLIIGNFTTLIDIEGSTSIITGICLTVILFKAGLGIERAIIKDVGIRALLLGTIPNLIEGTILAFLSYYILNFTVIEAGMFGFIISAVSPAVVIPSMSKLKDNGYDESITTMNLASTSFDDVVSLTIFAIFLTLFNGEGDAVLEIVYAPIKILLGSLIGIALGFIFAKILKTKKSKTLNILQYSLIFGSCLLLKFLGSYIFIIEMLAIMILGFIFNDQNKETSKIYIKYTNSIWKWAQVFLFFTIGFLTDLTVVSHYALIGIILILLGLTGRVIGVFISLHKSRFSKKEKSFCAISNIPKATVQAVLGAVPLSIGVANGNIILSIAALSIIFTAPIGLILIEIFAPKCLSKKDIVE